MLTLQREFVRQDIPCIAGGDTNNVQNEMLSTMIGDWNAPTNISADEEGGLTTGHNSRGVQKTYDGFFVNPDSMSKAMITEIGGTRFNDLGNGRVEYKPYTPTQRYATHETSVGMPWQRKKTMAQSDRSSFTNVGSRQSRTELRSEMPPEQSHSITILYRHYIAIEQRNKGNEGRSNHLFKASSEKCKLRGDALKSNILEILGDEIAKSRSIGELQETIERLKKGLLYKTLATGQGLATRLSAGCIKTSSVIAFEKMCAQKKEQIESEEDKQHAPKR